ncbi:acyltransferase [Enterobacter sp. Ap-1006]|uniref:acyltransferase family protein n=1 Tax=Enterobacter sp. Ap-1006 TaxID=2608345 RepID=UPI00141FD8D1|nr:acyltransferase [Enterobacter sp. Ap-1006]NIF46976.1 acyltransferase [Enterobacter sp. Ap-1006]
MNSIYIANFIKKDNNNLDFIRLLCAYFVIYSHAYVLAPSFGSDDILYKTFQLGDIGFGSIAVKTFFLISGILITNSLMSGGNLFSFVISRFARIYPAFFVVVVISATVIGPLVSTLSLSDYFSSNEVWLYISKTLRLNIQYLLPGVFNNNALPAINGSIWTIPMEVKAYLYLMLTYLLSMVFGHYKKYFIAFISIVIIAEPFTPFKGVFLAKTDVIGIYLLYPFFSIGCLLALFKENIKTHHLLLISVSSLIAFIVFSKSELNRTFCFHLFSSLFLIYIASTPLIKKIKINNDISYGVYLWAFPAQQLIASAYPHSPYINMIIAFILSSILGLISFHVIENPSMVAGRKIKKSRLFLRQGHTS